ncbi:MAG: hypothetical protein CVU84_15615 [Firmicutes bacterium HGW-Firmicutes-1]|nr:MAG: hypothetical protein CVU84_15615 [Firmicutes bacterium HGW-Firmicutes-1]
MSALIFLLSENRELQEVIQSLLSKEHLSVLFVNRHNLMSKIYHSKPNTIIIDINSFTENALLTIQSTLAVEYIPTICILSTIEATEKAHYIKDSIYLPLEHITTALPLLVIQAIHFMRPYTKLNQTHDTVDLMNEELKSTFDYYIKSQPEYENEIIALYFKSIYLDNIFLDNHPTGIWLIDKGLVSNQATLFLSENGDMNHKTSFSFLGKTELLFDDFIKTGFIKSLNEVEYSDADDLHDLLPAELLNVITPTNNIVGYGINNLIIIAFDYVGTVSQFETHIIKALAIKIDLMKNMKLSMKEVEDAFIYTMNAIARAAEGRDDLTGHHIKRVSLFSKILCENLQLGNEYTNQLMTAAQMHDVGKIYIDDSILLKPGKLTLEEFDKMKQHTVFGQLIIGDSSHLTLACQIARSHHEKFDGSGYPDGKVGEEIPLAARIVTLADIYDALRSARSYKPLFTHQQAYDIIVYGDGRVEPKHFDPIVLRAFIETHETFDAVYNKYTDK